MNVLNFWLNTAYVVVVASQGFFRSGFPQYPKPCTMKIVPRRVVHFAYIVVPGGSPLFYGQVTVGHDKPLHLQTVKQITWE